ncbi:hypothetical protein IW140_006328 [Coemansia sp. RSA 1813]|nr:hypothetical protein IW140_006328 [Coemansia sp. RSA 1813]
MCLLSSGTIKRSRSVLFRNGVDTGMRPYSATDLPLGPDTAAADENDGLYGGGMKAGIAANEHLLVSEPLRTDQGCYARSTAGQAALTSSTAYFSSLQQLDLRFCKGVRDYSLQRLAPRLSTLSILNLAGGQRADITIAKLSQHMYNLRRVSLAWTSNLTDFGISELVQRCKGIQALDLTYCTQIEDTSMFAIAHHLKDLRALSVAYCASVSDIGVREVAARCRSIRVLNVAKCFRVSERIRMGMEQQKIVTICDPFAPFSISEDPYIATNSTTLS